MLPRPYLRLLSWEYESQMLYCLRSLPSNPVFSVRPDTGSQTAAVNSAPDSNEGMSRPIADNESITSAGRTSKSRDQHLGILTANASRMATADGNFRFRILHSAFEKATGFHLQVGRLYSIKGRIEGVGSFEAMHIGAKKKCIFLYSPSQYRQNLKPGESYKIVVISIEQRKSFRVETIRGLASAYP